MKKYLTVFMILFGINFNAYYLLLFKKFKQIFRMDEVRWYLIIIAFSTIVIVLNLNAHHMASSDSIRHALFQVASIITTSGYATLDFDLWPSASKLILVGLIFIGACAGSTGGGIKVSRILIAIKNAVREMYSYIHPRSIKQVKMDGKPLDNSVVRSVSVYLLTFFIIFSISLFAISFDNKDFTTNFTAVATTLNNVGPGLSMVGPTQNFGHFSVFAKYVFMFDMLAGRLELFPLLILFHPSLLKDWFTKRK